MSPYDVPRLLAICPPELVPLLCLDLILEEFERPDEPERGGSHDSRGEELGDLRVHEVGLPSADVQHADERAQEANVAQQDHADAFVDFGELPLLVRLPTHLAVLKRALHYRSEYASANAASHGPQLDPSRARYLRHHRLVPLKPGVEHLCYRELA